MKDISIDMKVSELLVALREHYATLSPNELRGLIKAASSQVVTKTNALAMLPHIEFQEEEGLVVASAHTIGILVANVIIQKTAGMGPCEHEAHIITCRQCISGRDTITAGDSLEVDDS